MAIRPTTHHVSTSHLFVDESPIGQPCLDKKSEEISIPIQDHFSSSSKPRVLLAGAGKWLWETVKEFGEAATSDVSKKGRKIIKKHDQGVDEIVQKQKNKWGSRLEAGELYGAARYALENGFYQNAVSKFNKILGDKEILEEGAESGLLYGSRLFTKAGIYLGLGQGYAGLNQFGSANGAFQKAQKLLGEQDIGTNELMALNYYRWGKAPQAVRAAKLALRSNSDNPIANAVVGIINRDISCLDTASSQMSTDNPLYLKVLDVHANRHIILAKAAKNDPHAARDHWLKAKWSLIRLIELSSKKAAAFWHARLGEADAALRDLPLPTPAAEEGMQL